MWQCRWCHLFSLQVLTIWIPWVWQRVPTFFPSARCPSQCTSPRTPPTRARPRGSWHWGRGEIFWHLNGSVDKTGIGGNLKVGVGEITDMEGSEVISYKCQDSKPETRDISSHRGDNRADQDGLWSLWRAFLFLNSRCLFFGLSPIKMLWCAFFDVNWRGTRFCLIGFSWFCSRWILWCHWRGGVNPCLVDNTETQFPCRWIFFFQTRFLWCHAQIRWCYFQRNRPILIFDVVFYAFSIMGGRSGWQQRLFKRANILGSSYIYHFCLSP